MDAAISTVVVIAAFWAWLSVLGIPRLHGAYRASQTGAPKHVGWFRVVRNGWNPWSRGLIRIAADEHGLCFYACAPPYWRRITIPYEDLWIRDAGERLHARFRIGFLKCPGVTYLVAKTLVPKVQEATGKRTLAQCIL